jgi:hypothetical protein
MALTLLGAAASAAGQSPPHRTSRISLSAPAQFNLTLAQVRFRDAAGVPSGLGLAQSAGHYFVAGAVLRRPQSGGPRALILAVNERPRGSLAPDLTRLGVRVTAARKLGAPSLRQLVNPLPRAVGAPAATLCGTHPRTLAAGDLRSLLSAGRAPAGFGAAAAIAQAYDVACARPYNAAFVAAVTGCGASTGIVAGCCPPNALCAAPPAPAPTPTPAPAPTPTPTPTPMPTPNPPPCSPCQRPPCVTQVCPLTQTTVARVIVCPLGSSLCAQ